MIDWNPFALGGVLALLLSWGLAVVILRHGHGRMQSKLLAFLLVAEGTWTGTAAGALYAMEDVQAAYAMQLIGTFAANATAIAYLLFVGTLDTPLRRIMGHRAFQVGLMALILIVIVDLARRPDEVILTMFSPPYATWEAAPGDTGPANDLFPWTLVLGLVIALWAWLRAAPGTTARGRAAIIALAFVVRDVLWFILTVPVIDRATVTPPNIWLEVYIQGHGVATGLFALLLAYGILRHQILDIDLKIKLALEKSTLVAIFTGTVFALSELIEQVLDVDQLLPALLVAGLIAVAVRPLQRSAARIADMVMPDVQDTREYRYERGRELYEAALEAAHEDGEITDKERGMLATLAERLGLAADEVLELESRGTSTPSRL